MELSELLTKETAEIVAQHIVYCAEPSDGETVSFDCDFKLNQGQFLTEDINTWLKFDLKDRFFCQELKDIQQELIKSELKEEYDAYDTWTRLVSTLLETKYKTKLVDKIRKNLLSNTTKELMPMNSIEVKTIELDELPVNDKTMKINKMSPKGHMSSPVSEEIFNLMNETGKSAEQIIEEKKDEGNPDYKYITGVNFTKTFFEVSIEMWVDYSLNPETNPSKTI